MSRPRFLADEDWRLEIVQAVWRAEPAISIDTVQEMQLAGTSDPDILAHAAEAGLIVLSHDVSTMKGIAEDRIAQGQGITGLFLARQSASTRAIAESILLVWSASLAEEWENRIVYLPI